MVLVAWQAPWRSGLYPAGGPAPARKMHRRPRHRPQDAPAAGQPSLFRAGDDPAARTLASLGPGDRKSA
jgi:hypothetical protein